MITTKKSLKHFIILLVFLGGCESNKNNPEPEMPCTYSCDVIADTVYLSWEDIFKAGVTNLAGQTIVIKSKVYWSTNFGYFDVKPEINPAGSIKLLFENADSYISNPDFQGENRGDLFLASDKIEKYIDHSEKQEKYALDCAELSNGDSYYLIQGKIKYRDWLGIDSDDLNNPEFIRQSNNVVYWSQTFEFISEKIRILP